MRPVSRLLATLPSCGEPLDISLPRVRFCLQRRLHRKCHQRLLPTPCRPRLLRKTMMATFLRLSTLSFEKPRLTAAESNGRGYLEWFVLQLTRQTISRPRPLRFRLEPWRDLLLRLGRNQEHRSLRQHLEHSPKTEQGRDMRQLFLGFQTWTWTRPILQSTNLPPLSPISQDLILLRTLLRCKNHRATILLTTGRTTTIQTRTLEALERRWIPWH